MGSCCCWSCLEAASFHEGRLSRLLLHHTTVHNTPHHHCTTTHHTAYCTAPHCTQPSTQLSRLLHHCCHTVHTTTPLLLPHCTQLSTQPPHSTLVLAHCLHTALACTLLVDCHTAWACTLSLCLLFCTLSRVRSSNVLPQNIYNIQCGQ